MIIVIMIVAFHEYEYEYTHWASLRKRNSPHVNALISTKTNVIKSHFGLRWLTFLAKNITKHLENFNLLIEIFFDQPSKDNLFADENVFDSKLR